MKKNKLAFVLLCIASSAFAQNRSSARPPLMGWSSWNNYGLGITENIIKSQANAMVSSGLANAGYNYISLDDGYFDGRNSDGSLNYDHSKFPNGMKVVADYIHSKNLRAGIYTDVGTYSCGAFNGYLPGGFGAGIYGHEQQDANLFFNTWGYDYLKADFCATYNMAIDEETRYSTIKTAINNTGRTDVNFNVCRWVFPGTWVTKIADSWRISADIYAQWQPIIDIIDRNYYLAPYCSKGHYNDMDMLEVGRGMSFDEDKSHFSMWCIMSSPLVLGNDMTNMSTQTKNILTNSEVIAVDQDSTGLQAHIVTDNGNGLQVWAKNLNGKQSLERAVVLLNRTGAAATMSVNWVDLNLVGGASVRDLWSHSNLGTINSTYSVTVPSHGVVMLKVVGTNAKLQEVFEAEYAWLNNFNHFVNENEIPNQARVVKNSQCSGNAMVGYVGNNADNYIDFRDVFTNTAGQYQMTITYSISQNRNITVGVNGKDTLLSNLNSGNVFKDISFPINLKKGNNVIRVGNPTALAPDIDKIRIDLKGALVITAINCTAGTGDATFEHISRVQIGTIDNSSTATTYSDFTSKITNAPRGTSMNITITNGDPYINDSILIWCDWNNDKVFNEVTELAYTAGSTLAPYTGSIAIPANAVLGNIKMRIRIYDVVNGPLNPTPCGDAGYGEVEDYTLKIVGNTTSVDANTLPTPSLNFYPNPSNGEFTIEIALPDNGNYNLEVVNVLDQIVYIESLNINSSNHNFSKQISLSDLPKGVYMVKLNGNGINSNKNIIIR